MKRVSAPIGTALVCLVTAFFFYWSVADSFLLLNDEGIFLDGARRILSGQVPYKDFFLLMGPGSFWLQATALRVFGMTLAAGRVVSIVDLAILAGCVYWLIARHASAAIAAFTAFVCLQLITVTPGAALPGHRWDSAALAMLSATLVACQPRRGWMYAAGSCAGFAAWCTPTVALVGLLLIVMLAATDRGSAMRFLTGVAVVSVACAGVLLAQHALWPMIQHMMWTGSNYSQANRVPYGSLVGGYAQFFKSASGGERVVRGLIVSAFALPAILPPLTLLSTWMQRNLSENRWDRTVVVACGVAMIAAAYPRPDILRLAYAAPFFCATLAPQVAGWKSVAARLAVCLSAVLLASPFLIYTVVAHAGEQAFMARAGEIHVTAEDATLIQKLEQNIPKGSSFFAYPYLPIAYFLTMADNPTRYSYLQPGMMTDDDEGTAIAELERRPAARVLYMNLSEETILRVWPNTDHSRLKLPRMEAFLAEHYREVSRFIYRGNLYKILEMRTDVADATQ
jgi:hypothetical protein